VLGGIPSHPSQPNVIDNWDFYLRGSKGRGDQGDRAYRICSRPRGESKFRQRPWSRAGGRKLAAKLPSGPVLFFRLLKATTNLKLFPGRSTHRGSDDQGSLCCLGSWFCCARVQTCVAISSGHYSIVLNGRKATAGGGQTPLHPELRKSLIALRQAERWRRSSDLYEPPK
jgi:hypothetical protein